MFHQIFCVLSLLIYQVFNKTLPRCVASQKKKKNENTLLRKKKKLNKGFGLVPVIFLQESPFILMRSCHIIY